jgi:hypothetical protein
MRARIFALDVPKRPATWPSTTMPKVRFTFARGVTVFRRRAAIATHARPAGGKDAQKLSANPQPRSNALRYL